MKQNKYDAILSGWKKLLEAINNVEDEDNYVIDEDFENFMSKKMQQNKIRKHKK